MKNLARSMKHEWPYILFTIPAVALTILFLIYPLMAGVRIAFLNWDGFSRTADYVGLANFRRIFRDPSIVRTLRNTLLFTVLQVSFCNIFGLGLALLFKRGGKFNAIMKTLVFMPFVISLVLSSYMIQNLLIEICRMFGWTNPLAVRSLVIPGLSIIAIWRDSGYFMVIYIAGLLSIDESMYEAASVEGAGPVTKFTRITLPMIMPCITANVTLLLASGLRLFDYSMTAVRGDSSESINVYVYRLIFPGNRAGYGQAVALTWLVAIFILTTVVSRILRSREVEV